MGVGGMTIQGGGGGGEELGTTRVSATVPEIPHGIPQSQSRLVRQEAVN
jgi:hypothetical protein